VQSSQPLFVAYLSATQLNITGDGTSYTVVYNATNVNQASAYNASTGIFTAPVTGRYLFTTCNIVFGPATSAGSGGVVLATPTINYLLSYYFTLSASTDVPMNGCTIATLNSGDTAKIILTITGSTKTAAINGNASNFDSFFCGTLLTA
jgi:C1q domain